MAPNHYATLGIAPTSPRQAIRAAYLELMRRYHPDKNPSPAAAARVRAITAAYAVLSVAEERAKYDVKRRSKGALRWRALTAERPRLRRTAWPELIAAGAAILVLVASVVPSWLIPENGTDRSRSAGKTIASAPPLVRSAAAISKTATLCSSGAASLPIKAELFRRAAQVHGSNPAALERISRYSVVRFTSRVAHYGAGGGGVASCKVHFVLHLPPGVTTTGGRQSLNGIVGYSLRGAGAGAGSLSLTTDPAIVKSLAFLAGTSSEGTYGLHPSATAGQRPTVPQVGIAPRSALSSPPVVPVRRSEVQRGIVGQRPSFSCSDDRSWAEISVCRSASLAALDRAMASLWGDSMERANASQRESLLGSDKRFISRRNECSSEACVRDTYLAGMDNIRAIMSGASMPR